MNCLNVFDFSFPIWIKKMAYFPALLVIVSLGTTAVTSTSIYFKTKLELAEENKTEGPNYDIGTRTKLEETLVKKLEDFRGKMKGPQPDLNLPTLDPLSAGNFNVGIERHDTIELNGNISAVSIEGLSSFQLTRLKIYVAQMKGYIKMTLPKLTIESQYDLNGTLSIIKIPTYGKGNAKLTLHNVGFEASPHFTIADKHLALSELNLDWNLAAWLEVSVDGLYCTSSELSTVLSRAFSDLTPRLLRNYHHILRKYANDILFDSVNALLANLSLGDIIAMIPQNSTTPLVH